MPMLIADHHLKNFDDWIKLFAANPPPSVGNWRLMRGTEDPNRVYVIGDFATSEADDVRWSHLVGQFGSVVKVYSGA